MRLLWQKELDKSSRAIPSNYNCDFFIESEKAFFAYCIRDTVDGCFGKKIIIHEFDKFSGNFSKKMTFLPHDESSVLLTNGEWRFFKEQDRIFLDTGIVYDISGNVAATSRLSTAKKSIELVTTFDNITLKYNEAWLLTGFRAKEQLWKIKLKGYIYTPIEYKNGDIVFGTAGAGGGLYYVDIISGEVKSLIINGGAAHYAWFDDKVLLKDKKGNLQLVNLFSDKTIDTLILSEKLSGYSPIVVDENRVYTVAFNKKITSSERTFTPFAVCVEI